MKEERSNKLDKLFKEKLQHAEISPEDNYWPFIEQKINKPSFLKFGWRHINIYNLSLGILLLSLTLFYFLKSETKKTQLPIENPVEESTISDQNVNVKSELPILITGPDSKKESKINSTKEKPLQSVVIDSTPIISAPKIEEPLTVLPDTASIKIVEKKKKPKEIIYIIQQDTIIEKDTVKVRRLRKK